MRFPCTLVMRNNSDGCIWQAYRVENDQEVQLLTETAQLNGFLVKKEEDCYATETCPGWRNTPEWQARITGVPTEKQKRQQPVYDLLKTIKRDGPYWLGGYKDWLVACFSIRDLSDFQGVTPIACWSESGDCCKQWMVCVKDGQFFVDQNFGTDSGRGYGLKPVPVDSLSYPPHIYDWIFKTIIPNYKA